jgi:hypothetical protein
MAATSPKIVPNLMFGWNPKPRYDRPVFWQPEQRPRVGKARVTIPATDAQMASQVAAAKAFVVANPAVCDANTILAYSWNEHGEGYRCMNPTRANPTGTHLPLIAAALA